MERSREKREGVSGLYVIKGLTGITDADWERYLESLKPQDEKPSLSYQVAHDVTSDFRDSLNQAVRERQAEVLVSHNCPAAEVYAHTRAYWHLIDFLESKGLTPGFDHGLSYDRGRFRNYYVLSLILSPPAEALPEEQPA